MKRIALVFLFVLSYYSNLFSQQNKAKNNIVLGEWKCSTINVSDTINRDSYPVPIWTDIRLEHDRENLVREGSIRALKKLNCSLGETESNFIKFYDRAGLNKAHHISFNDVISNFHKIREPYGSNCAFALCLENYWSNKDYIHTVTSNRIFVSFIYRQAPGGYNLQGRMTPEFEQTTGIWNKTLNCHDCHGKYEGICKSFDSHDYYDVDEENFGCISESLSCNIEIFDIIFRTKELWIPSEERWAETALEAVIYLVLHELAHLENFIYKSSELNNYIGEHRKYELRPFGDTEEAAWEYASTIIREFTCNEKQLSKKYLESLNSKGLKKGSYWRKTDENSFFLYKNGINISGLAASFNGSDILAYDEKQNVTYLLEDFTSTTIDKVLKEAITISNKKSTFYSRNLEEDTYKLFVNGELITGVNSSMNNEDRIVYDPKTKKTYLLENFISANNFEIKETSIISRGKSIFYSRNLEEDTYKLFVDGELITEVNSSMNNEDRIVYNPKTRKTYLLKEFNSTNNFELKEASIISSGKYSFYSRNLNEDTYKLFVEGMLVTGVNSSMINKDRIVYDPKTKITYLLRRYSSAKNHKLRKAKILTKEESIFYSRNIKEETYFFYINGNLITGLEYIKKEGDDLYVLNPETDIKYKLLDYYKAGNLRLKKAIEY